MFDQENRVIVIINKLADLVILSVMWLVSCLPLVTVGAACAAAYDTVIDLRRDSGHLFRGYFARLGQNFKGLWHLTLGLWAAAGGFSAIVVRLWPIRFSFFGGVYFFMTCFFVLTVVIYAVHLNCLCGRFTLPRKGLMKVALWMTFTRPQYNLLLAFVVLGLVWMTQVFPPVVLIMPGLFFWFLTYIEEPGFHRFVDYEDDLRSPVEDDITRSA